MIFFEKLEKTNFYTHLKKYYNKNIIDFFRDEIFEGRKGLKVLELAAGSGFGTEILAKEQNVDISIASDINLNLLKTNDKFKGNFVISDVFKSSFKNEIFDFVWNSSSLEHFDNPKEVLQIMASLTKKGGYVFSGVPYMYGPLSIYYLLLSKEQKKWIGKPYSYEELKNLFESAKLTPQKHIIYFFNFFLGFLAKKK